MSYFDRTSALIGESNIEKIKKASVLVVGLGGVGAACTEALARSAIGNLYLLDFDTLSKTNINRQLIALRSSMGENKSAAALKRVFDINPECNAKALPIFLNDENLDEILSLPVDYIIDCIDTVSSKLALIEGAVNRGIPIISSMGTGNRLNPSNVTSGDIKETAGYGCPLSRIMRRELKKRGITSLPVVFSTEMPTKTVVSAEHGRNPPASSVFVPNVAGFTLAYKVISDIISE